MAKLIFLSFFIITLNSSSISYAEENIDYSFQRMEKQDIKSFQQIEELRLEQQKTEVERLRNEAEFQRVEAELAHLRAEEEAAEREQELIERAEQAAQEQEKTAQEAEAAVDEMRSQLEQSEVWHKNQIFFGIVILTTSIFLGSVVKKYKKEGFMKDHEKFGIITILISGLLILLVVMISQGWQASFDFIQNLMTSLQVRLFQVTETCTIYLCEFSIDFPTKYAVLTLLALASYGLTTYLGITPVLKTHKLSFSGDKEEN